MFRNALSNTRLGFSYGDTGPAWRAANWFAYTQIASNYAITEAMLKRYEELALAGAAHYAKTGNVGAPLTASALGYRDSTGFTALKDAALDNGFTVEELAEKALRRKDKNVELFDLDTVRKVMTLVTSRVAGESSPLSRPAYMLTSKFARMNGMLVGWSFFKTAQVLRMMRDPEGRRSVMATAMGLKALALGMVPMAIAFSVMLDEFDEEVLGKKSNLKPLGGEDLFGALVERSTAMGAFGIGGNVLDTMMNYKDGTGRFGLSVDQSIVWLNSATQLVKVIGSMYQMGPENANWSNVGRPIANAFGLNGVLQYVQIANKMFPETLEGVPLFSWEKGSTARTHVGNLLRAAGRDVGLEVRMMGGSSTPNAATPWITNMALAAYRDDPEEFQKAYRGAVEAAAELSADPRAYVARAFQTRHPLRATFRSAPTNEELQRIMAVLPGDAQMAVRDAIRLFNRYGTPLGIEPYLGSDGKSTAAVRRAVQRRQMSVDEMRAMLASRRTEPDDSGY
jgi:hypothetical protein